MKKENLYDGITYAGLFLGAGFCSGEELWQFFGKYGYISIAFYGISLILFYILTCSAISAIKNKDNTSAGNLISNRKAVITFWNTVELLILYFVSVIMISAFSELASSFFPEKEILLTVLFTLALYFLTLGGIERMQKMFVYAVPALAVIAIGVSFLSFTLPKEKTAVNELDFSLISSPIVGSVTYATHNIFGALGVILPLWGRKRSKKDMKLSVLIGAIILFLLGSVLILALLTQKASNVIEMPILYLSSRLPFPSTLVFSAALLISVFTAALSSLIALNNQLCDGFIKKKSSNKCKKSAISKGIICTAFPNKINAAYSDNGRKTLLFILILSAFILSRLGFGNLISFVYPLFGYLTVPYFIILICKCFRKN